MKVFDARFFILGLALIVFTRSAAAQTRDWRWALSGGGLGNDAVRHLATDPAGNIYAAGFFYDNARFGTATLRSRGGQDSFICKISPQGQYLWAVPVSGSLSEDIRAIAFASDTALYVFGDFTSDTLQIGRFRLANANPSSAFSTGDIFLARLRPATGACTMATRFGGPGNDFGHAMALRGNSIGVAGGFSDSIHLGGTTLASKGQRDLFAGSLDPSTVQWNWARSGGGRGDDQAFGAALDQAGNLCVTGYFESDTLIIGNRSLANAGQPPFFGGDLVVLKLEPHSGSVLWAAAGGGADVESGNDVALDSAGNVYVTGQFGGADAAFGTTHLTGAGNSDLLTAKLDGSSGAFLWVIGAGATGYEYGNDLKVDRSGHVWIIGDFTSPSFRIGSLTILNRAAGYDPFLMQMEAQSGVVQAAWNLGGFEYDFGNALALDDSGNVLVAGEFYSSILFLGNTTISNAGSSDLYLAKLGPTQATATSQSRASLPWEGWPNPAHASFRISGAKPGSTLELVNAQGQTIRSVSCLKSEIKLDIENLPPGLYTLRCGSQVRKVIIE